jgi:DNA-binding NarL/FixJ family response regulator
MVLSEQPHCLVIDSHPLVRLGVRQALGEDFVVHETATRDEAIGLIRDVGSIDIAIVDMRRGLDDEEEIAQGHEAIRLLRRASPAIGIVAHGERPERYLATMSPALPASRR